MPDFSRVVCPPKRLRLCLNLAHRLDSIVGMGCETALWQSLSIDADRFKIVPAILPDDSPQVDIAVFPAAGQVMLTCLDLHELLRP